MVTINSRAFINGASLNQPWRQLFFSLTIARSFKFVLIKKSSRQQYGWFFISLVFERIVNRQRVVIREVDSDRVKREQKKL
jgi:hypothetical protein